MSLNGEICMSCNNLRDEIDPDLEMNGMDGDRDSTRSNSETDCESSSDRGSEPESDGDSVFEEKVTTCSNHSGNHSFVVQIVKM